ncbi:threonyl-tRNA synthetase [Nadsonia fulvescens var. elongata DSM 6958]|uniref:Threonine--tRNA ligase, cytoplasmic n=1 Tax=Nadsonia fulvescens var. elongata DSM 6958 TaxID=857566 RepID=A0A1E3PS40_9ASCO|nr:threonyl-tRNA synthetase [Nadsonia fulvescens var. elongata DSM 6958]
MCSCSDNVADKLADVNIQAPAAAEAPKQVNKKEKKEKKAISDAAKAPLELDPKPEFLQHRIDLFDKLMAEQVATIAAKERKPITITLKDGSIKEGTAWETSPMEIAKDIAKSLSEKVIIAKVNDTLWDLERVLEDDCTVELYSFDDEEGKKAFWHSSAHVLGNASERHFGCKLCIGPTIEDGFFYEMSINDGETAVSSADFPALETLAKSLIKEKKKFERLVLSKEDLLEMFKHNEFKQTLIKSKIADGVCTTAYRCGSLIDLCHGPHIPHTGRIKAFKLLKNSASYFLGDSNNASLQRIYGIAFPDKKLMDEHVKFLEEASRRDHRKIGKEQELFLFNDMSPGSCFWLPHGARIYSTLQDFLRKEYRKRGYEEVITPNMYNSKLWETSGHWQNYKENMFTFDVEKEVYGLKPMNCPGHCLIFKSRERSYRELPWRVADFGVIHRNEFSGALSGLTRVRRFQQDDAHIFCTQSQIGDEIKGIFDFLALVYGTFGFDFKMELSTRPEKYVGDLETWNNAENKLQTALEQWGGEWEINAGDGAFYGPKIDIMISDALKRWHQCATIQLDFQLPNRFDLNYRAADDQADKESEKYSRPVMIHRAIYGSFERMAAILTEHYAGKWPFWLSPRQVTVIPVGTKYNDYATKVKDQLNDAGFFADCDLGPNTLQKKVRSAQLQQYNFIFIVGDEEEKTETVNIRNRDDQSKQGKNETVALKKVISALHELNDTKRRDNILSFE